VTQFCRYRSVVSEYGFGDEFPQGLFTLKSASITIATYNIHKGLSPLNRKLIIHDVRETLHAYDADIVLLQEVQGVHTARARKFAEWPTVPQHEHIAGGRYTDIVYGVNARHRLGDHGNAILSSFPIEHSVNHDVSHHRFESRGHLFASIDVPALAEPLICVCVHLGLFHRSRLMQVERLIDLLSEVTPGDSPLVIAGDFNDWRAGHSRISDKLADRLGVVEAFESSQGKLARTFPAVMPMLTLDRIYVRGMKIEAAHRLHGEVKGTRWRRMSDHLGLAVTLRAK
jgi:endonuclease/exonuclease/phosphatase family metal-dependent hydrolase